jgi:hypothetical protein
VIADHWGFVIAAYAVAVLAFGSYWRRLVRIERQQRAPRLRTVGSKRTTGA